MTPDSLRNPDWPSLVARLGGARRLAESARESKAFLRPRVIASATDLLRLILAYCLGEQGLRSTAAWASALGLADISNVALLQRLRRCGTWFSVLIGQALASGAPRASHGRLIRIVDATTVPQAGAAASRRNRVWRIHSAFDLPAERFGCFELTDERGGERLDRIPVVKGEIRLADRAYAHAERIAPVLAAGADVVVRAGWRSARWLDRHGRPFDLIQALREAERRGWIDQSIWLGRKSGPPLRLRLIAVKKPEAAAAAARRKARRDAQRERYQISKATLRAAGWVTLITSLQADAFSTRDVLSLYRLRWRIELGFKRLKSVVGLKGPPGSDQRSARPWLLAHLLLILLLEPLVDELEDSPRWAHAA
jgi:hypothetical protein